MNKNNETYSYKNMDMNLSTSEFNSYNSFINQDNTYNNTLNATLFPNFKNKYIYNLKRNFNNNLTPNYSRNFIGRNYAYNQNKVMSLHKIIKKKREDRLKTLCYDKVNKNINLMHRNELKNKLLQSKIYKLILKTANENFLKEKRKKNTFITSIEEDDLNKKGIINMNKNKLKKTKKNKVKILLDLSPSINNYETENIKTPIKEKNSSFVNPFNSEKNKSLNIYDLTNISLPCIKFNNSLNTLNTNPKNRNCLAQTSLAKLKIEIINKELNESYKAFFEKRDFPVGLTEAMYRSYLIFQKHFFVYDDLNKKYMQFLTNEIKNNIVILGKLIQNKDTLIKENDEKLKQISSLDEQIKIFDSFNNLYLNLKNKSEKLNPSSPKKNPNKIRASHQRQITYTLKRASMLKKSKEFHKRRETQTKMSIKNGINLKQNTIINNGPKKARELFKNTQEIREIFEERDRSVFKAYEKYLDVIHGECILSLQKEKMKENNNPEIKETNELLDQLKKELILLKIKNKDLTDYKNSLIKKKKENEEKKDSKTNNDININIYKVILKAKQILLNLKINLENFLQIKDLYEILKEKEFSGNVTYKGEIYSKELFYIKVLEILFLKIDSWRNNCLNDKNLRRKYLKIKAQREKEIKYLKCEQNLIEEKMNALKKKLEIMNKNNKIIISRNKKFDPFYKRYIQDDIYKKRMKSKEHLDKYNLENEYNKYNNYLYY